MRVTEDASVCACNNGRRPVTTASARLVDSKPQRRVNRARIIAGNSCRKNSRYAVMRARFGTGQLHFEMADGHGRSACGLVVSSAHRDAGRYIRTLRREDRWDSWKERLRSLREQDATTAKRSRLRSHARAQT